MKPIKKIKNYIIKSKGFLTKKGALIDYAEWHSLGIGVVDGVDYHGKGYRLEKRINIHEDVEEEPHYYDFGYMIGRTTKYAAALYLSTVYGLPIIQ